MISSQMIVSTQKFCQELEKLASEETRGRPTSETVFQSIEVRIL